MVILSSTLDQLSNSISSTFIQMVESIFSIYEAKITGISNICIGLGAIFLLFVVVKDMISILDGGKFQIKMLVPVFIFIIVCNFTVVAGPTLGFSFKLQDSLVKEIQKSNKQSLMEMSARSNKGKAIDPIQEELYKKVQKNNKELIQDLGKQIHQKTVDLAEMQWKQAMLEGNLIATNTPEVQQKAKEIEEMKKQLEEAKQVDSSNQLDKEDIKEGTDGAIDLNKEDVANDTIDFEGASLWTLIRNGWLVVFVCIISFICCLLSVVFQATGIFMTLLVVAFGPLSFAFAILPGGGSTIKTFFIRICQFSLYAPLAALIKWIYVSMVVAVSKGAGGVALPDIALLALGVVAITMYLAIPTTAGMIIEGASGGSSISSVVGMASGIGALAMGGTKGAYNMAFGKNSGASNFIRGLQDGGIRGLMKNGVKGTVERGKNLYEGQNGLGASGSKGGGSPIK